MKVLVTNDDGVASPGLHALVQGLVDAGYEPTVVAPSVDMSGAGASIGKLHIDQHIDAQRVDLPGLDGVPAFAVAGPPGLCVLAARLGGFGEPPDIVVSGINPGCNTGRAVLHSGTVGAALTAANFGLRGLAVSIDVRLPAPGTDDEPVGDEPFGARCDEDESADGSASDRPTSGEASGRHWASAAAVAAAAVPWLLDAPVTTVVNINVPDRPLDQIRGARWGNLASFGTVRSAVVEGPVEGGRLQMEFRPTKTELPPDSDTALVLAGYVAVTTITGVQATEPVDVAAIVGDLLATDGSG